jgi:ribokinase
MEKPKIVVLGGLNMDLVIKVPRLPVSGETIKGEQYTQYPGGKGANQAVAAARLGGEVTMIGCLGKDSYADQLLANLDKSGVNTDCIVKADTHTGVALIMVDKKGSNLISFAPGANGELKRTHVDALRYFISEAELFLVQNECSLEVVEHSIKVAKECEVPVVYNPAPAMKISHETIENCNVIIPNETEAEFFTGVKINTHDSLRGAVDFFLRRGCENVIITLGERGAFYKTKNGSEDLVETVKVKAVDTVAAGDVFLGAFVVQYASGNTMDKSIKIANYAAAISVTKTGAQTSIPSLEEVYKTYPILKG